MKVKKNSIKTVDELNFIKDWLKKRPTINELKFNQHVDFEVHPIDYHNYKNEQTTSLAFHFAERNDLVGWIRPYGHVSITVFFFNRTDNSIVTELKQFFSKDLRLIKVRNNDPKNMVDILYLIPVKQDDSIIKEYSCMYKLYCFNGKLTVIMIEDKVFKIRWSFSGKGYGSLWCLLELQGDKLLDKSIDSLLKREFKKHKEFDKFCAYVLKIVDNYNEVKPYVSFCKKYLASKKKGGEGKCQ